MVRHVFLVAALTTLASCCVYGQSLCEGIRFATIADPSDCRQFVVCSQGQASVERCPGRFVFHPTVQFCVKESQYDCAHVTTPAPEPEQTDSTETETIGSTTAASDSGSHDESGCQQKQPNWESFFCENAWRTFVANPMNCSQFIDCDSNPPISRHCPEGTIFNDVYQDCHPEAEDRECELATVNAQFCADRPDGSYPHPFQCNRFITCIRRVVRLETCPPFFVFDPSANHCVTGNPVNCSALFP
ncbi:chitin-binding domain protein cbd-1-like [Anopheles darlingi]|uniref:chitin-binding domain protein cbd-1-like n=1 Tax=Anopheles darlingi TaxID=43151 RepID=UPI00210010D9|nr:chitin-binding domain protein cbd-1-like [Anopheles darlingi]